ncbi:MAG: hypothetical protein JNL56_15070 [Alphaproteobacteria bacterium]|nr:hypothetical protein [Alphaproteobacteria bacterium]
MKTTAIAALAALLAAGAAHAAAKHPCADDAKARAGKLLALHFNADGLALAPEEGPPADDQSGDVMNWSLSDEATAVAPIKAPVGKGKFDVLEVTGYIYKAEYRMHLIYAQIPDACVLMGQEIIELSDPY